MAASVQPLTSGFAATKELTGTKISERVSLLQTYASDPKFKKYIAQVEKCLGTFDSVHEWADFIAFLKQLLKTFQSYQQFKEIPRKLVVAKRLSQCLNPALPTGVHQRALDVYAHILAVIGSDGLKRDLPLWSSGLFPFFEYAATSVKPILLNLYDTHYLPLEGTLRPITKSFVLALLPGLEEETGEFFDKVLGLLDKLSSTVSPAFFFQNMWLVMLTTPSARGTSLNFLSRRLPPLRADEDISPIVGRDVGLMIRAFAAALEDENLLVRRGGLDLLLQSLRIDSTAVKKAQAADRTILMRAAAGVVLRRDLSLNRRLYTWLLGPEEDTQHQLDFFKANSLDLLKSTLREEMFSPSMEYPESRPFKIFISLLDKWEIGASLTEGLVYDAFKALRNSLESHMDSGEEMLLSASSLYEAVEPHCLWRQVLSSVLSELWDGSGTEAIGMAKFILVTFRHDEEIQTIHLPMVFCAVMEVLRNRLQMDSRCAMSQSMVKAILLQVEMLKCIPLVALLRFPALPERAQTASPVRNTVEFATTFYGIQPAFISALDSRRLVTPLAMVFEDVLKASAMSAQGLIAGEGAGGRDFLEHCLLVLNDLVKQADLKLEKSLLIDWDPVAWLSTMLSAVTSEVVTFSLLDRTISIIVAFHHSASFEPSLSMEDSSVVFRIVNKLFEYLRSDRAGYHVRASNLIWEVQNAISRPYVESIISQKLAEDTFPDVEDSFEAFGVLWRLTEDHLMPGFKWKCPLMIILNTLKSEDPRLHRLGETWMRCNLKSYLRILDPLLFDLLDPNIRLTPTVIKVNGRELQSFCYDCPFDQSYVNHVLEILLAVARFGGQGFVKTARGNLISRAQHTGLVERAELIVAARPDASYLDVLVEILLRFIQSEPKPRWGNTMQPCNTRIQSTAIDLVQAVVARGEVDPVAIRTIEAIVIGKLYFTVQVARLDLQNKLLHLLHSVISAFSAEFEPSKPLPPRDASDIQGSRDVDRTRPMSTMNPLLVQTLIDGISAPANRPVLQHWLDFITTAIPQFQYALEVAVSPLNDCVCRQLRLALSDVLKAARAERKLGNDVPSSTTDAEFLMFLNVLERLVLISLANTLGSNQYDDDPALLDKTGQESSGLLGYVSNVFSSDNVAPSGEQLTARSPGYQALHAGVRVLYSIWVAFVWKFPPAWSPLDDSLAMIYSRSRNRCRRVLEHLFRAHSSEVLESIIECWSREPIEGRDDNATFEIVDILCNSAQNVVHLTCESVSCRLLGVSERTKKQAINFNLSDAVLFQFLEGYLSQLEGPLALQVWGRVLQMAKEIVGNLKEQRAQVFPMLRCITVLGEKVTQTTAVEERRLRKDFQDIFGKLLDATVSMAGRSFDQNNWIRRSAKDTLAPNGRDSPIPRVPSDSKLDEKMAANSPSIQEGTKPWGSDSIEQVNRFLVEKALPNMRRFFVESDKVAAACSNVVYYIITPGLKGKSRPLDVDPTVLDLVREMTKIPAALKAWRGPVTDVLNDNRFFNSTSQSAQKFRPIIRALFDVDRASVGELLNKVTTAPSGTIFTNREYESLLRSLNLRRLSYAIFVSDKNHFLTQLPAIQEKLVDILRNSPAPILQSEVFLSVRVLLCRLSPHNLTSFWPVVLNEMYRVFDQIMTTLPSDGSEDLAVVLAACKVLDLLLVLQTEEFQIHQWIFITDTVDAVYRPESWSPEAMLDLLSDVVGSLPIPEDGSSSVQSATQSYDATPLAGSRPMRRPMLNAVHHVETIRDLAPFLSHVSIATYESIYASGGNIDWESIERGLLEDMFDGR
ncbi:hypothetical protein JAAARDRAFT_53285 [Jaapia argillacea MUCL 33604]|uniref:Uncharacterized protein n=1 Tax=Jaapia argillacea MUCL 33604 TaxID=933084 RepID=A0A067Q7N5_9AGAM|nr:hypothetical protein JAAARDRAFT_53285 [Jaapia argillacea MUCL 33604]